MNRNSYMSGFKNEIATHQKRSYDPLLMQASPEDIRILLGTGVELIYIMTNNVDEMFQEIRDTNVGVLDIFQRKFSFFEWHSNEQLLHCPDVKDRSKYEPSMQEKTLDQALDFLDCYLPRSRQYDADCYVILFKAADIFKNEAACSKIKKIIAGNANENNTVRKEVIIVGSEPYIPSIFNGIITCLRRDFNVDIEPPKVPPVDVDALWAGMVDLFGRKKVDISSKEKWVKETIKDLTEREVEDILYYLLDKDKDLLPSRLTKCIDDLQFKKQLFQFVG